MTKSIPLTEVFEASGRILTGETRWRLVVTVPQGRNTTRMREPGLR
jgi:hypothetical protein